MALNVAPRRLVRLLSIPPLTKGLKATKAGAWKESGVFPSDQSSIGTAWGQLPHNIPSAQRGAKVARVFPTPGMQAFTQRAINPVLYGCKHSTDMSYTMPDEPTEPIATVEYELTDEIACQAALRLSSIAICCCTAIGLRNGGKSARSSSSSEPRHLKSSSASPRSSTLAVGT